jgi:hypothetical protein
MTELLTEHHTVSSETEPTAEALGLPYGFLTEKGSAYTYNPDGSVHRAKYDGSQSDAGIAVFIEHTTENLDVFTRMGAEQSHLPPAQRKKAYVLQLAETEAGGLIVKGKVYKAKDVSDSSRLAFALIDGNNQIAGWVPAAINPSIGSMVFEMDKLSDGSTVRHPGHRVTRIVE